MNIKTLAHSFWDYLRAPVQTATQQSRNELREELEFHLTASFQDRLIDNPNAEDAKQETLRRFGSISAVVQECDELTATGPQFWHRVHILATLSLVIAVTWFSVMQPKTNKVVSQWPTDSDQRHRLTGDLAGNVANLAGQRVANANVIAVVKHWPKNGFRQQSYMTTTDYHGNFQFKDVYPDQALHYEVLISVVAEGYLMTSEYTNWHTGELEPYQFTLAKTDPFSLKFETENGTPVSGVAAFPTLRRDKSGQTHRVYFMGSDPIVRTSDTSGRVELPHFRNGDTVEIAVRYPGQEEWQTQEIIVDPMEQFAFVVPSS